MPAAVWIWPTVPGRASQSSVDASVIPPSLTPKYSTNTGPSQSIIRCFRPIGHGSPPWMTVVSVGTGSRARTSSGSASICRNIVGTMIVDAMPDARWSIAVAASHRSMTNRGVPCPRAASANVSGAPWKRRDTTRCRPSRGIARAPANSAEVTNASLNGLSPESARTTPLGRPVVPEVYDSRQP